MTKHFSYDPAGPSYTAMQTAELERFQFACRAAMPDVRFAHMQLEQVRDEVFHRMAYQLRASLFGEHVERRTVSYPKDWWQAFKAQAIRFFSDGAWPKYGHWPVFGDWLARRWPVEYTTVEIDVRALYHSITLPHERHTIKVVQQEHTGPLEYVIRDMRQERKPLFLVLRELLYTVEAQGYRPAAWAVGRKARHALLKMRDLNQFYVFDVSHAGSEQLFGIKLSVNSLVPDDSIELRDQDDKVRGRIFSVNPDGV